MDELDLPRPIPEAAEEAKKLGVRISPWKAYKLARDGVLPVSDHGIKMTTVRAIIAVLSPSPAPAGR